MTVLRSGVKDDGLEDLSGHVVGNHDEFLEFAPNGTRIDGYRRWYAKEAEK